MLQLEKRLAPPTAPTPLADVVIRNYQGEADIKPWLDLRRLAFSQEALGVRAWTPADFESEFLRKRWWNPQHMWLAEGSMPAEDERSAGASAHEPLPPLLGTVTLALRGQAPHWKPVVHWLCVHPGYRRRGLARQLLQILEARAWESGFGHIYLETHSAWQAANLCYLAQGYLPSRADRGTAGGE